MRVVVAGCKNSCNTYMMEMIRKHFKDVRVSKSHLFLKPANGIKHVIMTKNPYAWLLSMWKKPHVRAEYEEKHAQISFADFLRSGWRGFPTPMDRYSQHYRNYFSFDSRNPGFSIIVRSEDLQRNPRVSMRRTSRFLGLPIQPFENITRRVNPDGDLGEFFDLDYYLDEEWKSALTVGDIARINKHVDPIVFSTLGYTKL